GGEHVDADAVVCNADVSATYRTLLGIDAPRVTRRGRYSPSCVLWLAGVRGALPDDAAHHNIHFGRDWKGAFDALLRHGTSMPDPSTLVTVASRTDGALAPAGGATLYALEPTPNLDGRLDWSVAGPALRDDLLKRLDGLGYPVADVAVERFTDPPGWRARGLE